MEYNSFMEALKGKQKKLDKNHNGELDAQDFKILRKEETEELGCGCCDQCPHNGDPHLFPFHCHSCVASSSVCCMCFGGV